ncbi:GIY-YIG nuclease family protein [Candidatus Methylospira mobilis]|uniref:GIY-YIG nuclease family protein n=1 Tax=Candidatus Methylospira mobilis TaxID=1808979 RepID=A0A5Q0BN99_9GAMM|nr:GIY-YIG nuclease family protein [Candidatus Methylospira mobilis]QFY43711.1 GIY-YIG nuclease family protein [Candidatus Methylospira mobilis]
MANGFIYVLLNPSFPNMVKIGLTEDTSERRARNISSATGVPTDFIVLYDMLVNDVDEAEREIHAHFSAYRVNKRREFFYVPPKLAICALIDIAQKYPVAPALPAAIDDALPMLRSRFPKFLDPNIFSIRMITVPGSCYLKIGRCLNGVEEYSEEELPLEGLKTPDTVTPDVVEHNATLLATLDEYDWIMVSDIFPKEVALQIAKEWEGPGGKLEQLKIK